MIQFVSLRLQLSQLICSDLDRLIHDRELSLFDGTRLLRHDRYEEIKAKNGYNDEEMLHRGIRPIHPSFRIVALSEPPVQVGC